MNNQQLRVNANRALVNGLLGIAPKSTTTTPNPQGAYAVYFEDMEHLYSDVRVVCTDTAKSTGLDKAKAMVDSAVLSDYDHAGVVRACLGTVYPLLDGVPQQGSPFPVSDLSQCVYRRAVDIKDGQRIEEVEKRIG